MPRLHHGLPDGGAEDLRGRVNGESMTMRIVIIGNSAAGTAAIEAIRRHDSKSRIVQLSDEEFPLYSRCLLSYYLAGSLALDALLYRDRKFHEAFDVKLHAGAGFRAVRLDAGRQQIFCDNGIGIEYDRLLICTGSSAKLPSNLPKDIQGICVLRTVADAEKIKEHLRNVRNAVVLGAGLIGIKAATALSALGIHTVIVARSNRVLSQMIDAGAAQIIEKRLHRQKIEVLLGTDISEVRSNANTVTGIRTEDGRSMDCQLLIAAKGVSPNASWIDASAVEMGWGIKTDPRMRTSRESIYAAGDVAETFDIALEKHTVNALWTCAVEQGRIAGLNLIGKNALYKGALSMNSLNVCDVPLISFGIAAPANESEYRILARSRPEKDQYKKIVIGSDQRIKGIILLGNIENAGVLLSLIQKKIDVSSFEEELLGDRFNFGKMLKHEGESEMEIYSGLTTSNH
jgi:NAD(P)H-nitrite reductase large subunit